MTIQIAPTGEDDIPEEVPDYSEDRYIADHLINDARAYLRFDRPMICLEYNGDDWEEVASYRPAGENWYCVTDELNESSYDPIVEYIWRDSKQRFMFEVTNGYTPGYRIWATYTCRGTESHTPEGTEYDIEWDVDILWEDTPAWKKQKRYIISKCKQVIEHGGFCECGSLLGLSEIARKWNKCEQCAKHDEKLYQARQADSLYDLRQSAKWSYQRDIERDPGDRFDKMTEQELRATIKLHDEHFHQWLDYWRAMCT